MTSYVFKCKSCKEEFDKFRFGLNNLELWQKGELKITCPHCGKNKVERIITKGSGQFKSFKW